MEIERKFLITEIPVGDGVEVKKIAACTQGYYSFDPEVRFKSKENIDLATMAIDKNGTVSYAGTIKSVGMRVRDEVEGPITKEFYDHMVEVIGKPFITKLQYTLMYHGQELVASLVDQNLTSKFIYAEVEFKNEEEMNKFIWPWPEILIKEVSDDPDWYLQNYWKRTRGEN